MSKTIVALSKNIASLEFVLKLELYLLFTKSKPRLGYLEAQRNPVVQTLFTPTNTKANPH